jgi:hypothetical protein
MGKQLAIRLGIDHLTERGAWYDSSLWIFFFYEGRGIASITLPPGPRFLGSGTESSWCIFAWFSYPFGLLKVGLFISSLSQKRYASMGYGVDGLGLT